MSKCISKLRLKLGERSGATLVLAPRDSGVHWRHESSSELTVEETSLAFGGLEPVQFTFRLVEAAEQPSFFDGLGDSTVDHLLTAVEHPHPNRPTTASAPPSVAQPPPSQKPASTTTTNTAGPSAQIQTPSPKHDPRLQLTTIRRKKRRICPTFLAPLTGPCPAKSQRISDWEGPSAVGPNGGRAVGRL